MPHDVYYDFTQRPEHTRRIGAHGGRAAARNRRERLRTAVLLTPPYEVEAPSECEQETVAAAIAILDAQFPWLCGAERRRGRYRPLRALKPAKLRTVRE
jgi:hypothetical protein